MYFDKILVTFLDVVERRASNLFKVGQWRKYGFKYLVLNSRKCGQTSKKWYSSSIWFILHDLHILSCRGVLSYRPVSMDKLCDDVLL